MIFPTPIKEQYFEDHYPLKQDYALQDLYTFYQSSKDGSEDITFFVQADLAPEEYEISIDEQGVQITVSEEQGRFRALTSLRQLLQQNESKLPYALIQDQPDYEHRAYMLEISSGRMPKVPLLCEIIDYLAGLKYNEFQLYMENFCFKFSAFPEITADFDCLTPEDIRFLDQYCKDRFIELIPCQNGFGHMKTWLKEERWKHLAVKPGAGTLDPLLPESLELMDGIYGSLLPHFTSDKVNICLDETVIGGNPQLDAILEQYGYDKIFMDWMNKLADLTCNKYGKKTVQFWDDLIQSQVMENRCRNLEAKGVPFYVCPSTQTYSAFTGRFDVASFNIRTAAEVGRLHGAIGYMLTEWGNFGTPNFFLWSFVPTALGAQYAWNVGEEQKGGQLKEYYIHSAEQYVDETVFHAKVSKKLFQMANFYLLEPERIHGQTVCFMLMQFPLKQTNYYGHYHFNETGEDFYFDNIIYYMSGAIRNVREISFSDKYKRQIIVNAEMVILAAEYGRIKLAGRVSRAKYEEICSMTDRIIAEYRELWIAENYEEGMEIYINYMLARREELAEFLHAE